MKLAARKHPLILHGHLLKTLPPSTTTARHCSTDPIPTTTISSPDSPVNQIVSLLQTTPTDEWPTTTTLHHLLTAVSPPNLLKITRELTSSEKSLQFFNFLKTHQPLSPPHHLPSLSFTFQAVLEHVMKEHPNDVARLQELFTLLKSENIPLSIDSATLLIHFFGREKMVHESLSVFQYLGPDSTNIDIANLLLNRLLRAGATDDAFKVFDGILDQETDFEPNDRTLDIVLFWHWSRRNVSEDEIFKIVSKLGEHGVFPTNVWLTRLLTRFCKSGKCDKAWELLHEVVRLGGKVEAPACNALMTGLGKARDFKRMNLLMKEMKEKGIEPDVVTFGILINHLCKFRRVDEALEVFENIQGGVDNDGVSLQPDVVIYNTLIDGLCKVGREEEGLELMERMRSQQSCGPNTITYNCVIDGLCKVGKIEQARELFDRMIKEGVEPNVITLNTLIGGMCRSGRVSSGMEFFNEMKGKGIRGDARTYTVLITAFCSSNNIDKAVKMFDEMVENGCSPDAVAYYSLISGLSQAGRMDDATFVLSLMRAAGFCLDNISYNQLIGGFCRRNKMDKAFELLNDMKAAGVKPDLVTYNTIISHSSQRGDFATAHRELRNMINDGFSPNVVTYGALIHAYCKAGELDAAIEIFKEMNSASKVSPNTVIYNTLIDSLCKNHEVDVAFSLMDDMKKKMVKPNTSTFNALFRGLREMHLLDKALQLIDEMVELACHPDYITMEILVEWLPAVGQTEKLQKLVQGYEVSDSTTRRVASCQFAAFEALS